MTEQTTFQNHDLADFSSEQTHGGHNLYGEKFGAEPIIQSPQPTSSEDFIVVNGEKSPMNYPEEMVSKMANDVPAYVQDVTKNDKIVAEADSSSSRVQPKPTPAEQEPVVLTKQDGKASKKEQDAANCSICPYYMLSN